MRYYLTVALVACVGMSAAARGAPPTAVNLHTDQEAARHAVQAGQFKPLAQIVAAVQKRHSGRVIEIEVDLDESGRYVYEVKLLDGRGRILAINVDATTGAEMTPARGHGAIKPLAGVLRELLATTPGQVLEAELELGPGARSVYDVRILSADGRLHEMVIDARSGRVLEPRSRLTSDLSRLKPMVDAIDAVLSRYPAQVLEGELEIESNGRRYYEMELRLTDGRLLEVHVDAETLSIIGARGLNN